MTSITITAKNYTTQQFVDAINLANPQKEKVLASPAIVYPRGTMVVTPEVEMGIIGTQALMAIIKERQCSSFYSIDRKGVERMIDPTAESFLSELNSLVSGCRISYCCDVVDVLHRVNFNWVRLPYGWTLAYNVSLGLLMVDA